MYFKLEIPFRKNEFQFENTVVPNSIIKSSYNLSQFDSGFHSGRDYRTVGKRGLLMYIMAQSGRLSSISKNSYNIVLRTFKILRGVGIIIYITGRYLLKAV